MKKSLSICFLLLTLLATGKYTFANTDQTDFNKRVLSQLTHGLINAQHEKVYLHTDKPYYSAGEEIWFKAYLVNAITHKNYSLSRFIYVELIDKSNTVIQRVKIRKDSIGFSGNIRLNPETQAGDYALRAYTSWMRNAESDFFFSKNIYIGNSIDDRINCEIQYGTPTANRIPVTLSFTNTYGYPIPDKKVVLQQTWLNNRASFALTTDKEGKIKTTLETGKSATSQKILNVSINETYEKYNNKFFVPDFEDDFDLQFFPESGSLLSSTMQNIGFKAIGTNGLSVEVSGKVYDDTNESILDFESTHKGMGRFALFTDPERKYHAIVTTKDGRQKKFELPQPIAEGVSLQLNFNRDKIYFQATNTTKVPSNLLYLVIHTRGITNALVPLDVSEGQINISELLPGIATFAVIDKSGNTYCERLAFIPNLTPPNINMQGDRNLNGKREAANLRFNINDATTGKAIKGNFSISITDSKTVIHDTTENHILSYLLLSSDLKGHIEDPALYFADNSPMNRSKLDLLMLTQGWRRFNLQEILKNKLTENSYYMEVGQTLSGTVINAFNKPASGRDVIMLTGYKRQFDVVKTDSAGIFLIQGIEFPDSTTFILKAKSKTKLIDVELIPDNDEFPESNIFFPTTPPNMEYNAPKEYFLQIKEKYYTDGGMMVVNLDDFTVEGRKDINSNATRSIYAGMADNQITSEKIEQDFLGFSILDMLQTIPGVSVEGTNISIRGGGTPLLLVDDIPAETIDDISYLNSFDIENISVFKGANAAIFGSRGGNGAIAIYLKKGVQNRNLQPISFASIMPLGYQKPVEFYIPKYETDSNKNDVKPDLRTTIYWNPSLISDENGNYDVKFWTADKNNNYTVILEGVGENGEIVRFKSTIRRE